MLNIKENNMDVDIKKSYLEGKNILVKATIKKDNEIIDVEGEVSSDKNKIFLDFNNEYHIDITDHQEIVDTIWDKTWIGKTLIPLQIYTSEYKNSTRLKKKRLELGLSQSEFSNLIEINIKLLQKYESDPAAINSGKTIVICKIAKKLSCKAEELLEIEYL